MREYDTTADVFSVTLSTSALIIMPEISGAEVPVTTTIARSV